MKKQLMVIAIIVFISGIYSAGLFYYWTYHKQISHLEKTELVLQATKDTAPENFTVEMAVAFMGYAAAMERDFVDFDRLLRISLIIIAFVCFGVAYWTLSISRKLRNEKSNNT